MTAAVWQNPTQVRFGPDALDELGMTVRQLGTHALVVTDAGVVDTAGKRVRQALEQVGCRVSVHAAVRPHPGVGAVEDAVAALRDAAADVVVGVGGGSPMDVAKTVAAAARNAALLTDPQWAGPDGVVGPDLGRPRKPVPLVQVPTTSGTGSEVSMLASLADRHGRKRLLAHPLLYARVAVIDPLLATSLPARLTAEGSLEILSRLLLAHITETGRTPLQDRFAEATAQLVLERTPAALADGGDVGARSDLALAATSSVLGWASLGRAPTGNALWYLQNGLAAAGLSKGSALAALTPGYLRYMLAHATRLPRLGDPQRLLAFGRAAFRRPDWREPAEAVAAIEATLRAWELPVALAETGVRVPCAQTLARETGRAWGAQTLSWLPPGDLEGLYAESWQSDSA